jgi:hypothetical protein
MSKRDETVDIIEELVFMNRRTAICAVVNMLGIVMVRTHSDFQTVHFTKGFKWQHNYRACYACPKETKGVNTSF